MESGVAPGGGTFNGPLEAGIRAVVFLRAAYPRAFDLQRLLAFDYLLVHTGDISGGPESLHPPARLHSSQLLVRRGLVQQALLLMITRHLIEREATPNGILFRAGENAAFFVDGLASSYAQALKQRAVWLTEHLADLPEDRFKGIMRRFFDAWIEEFQSVQPGPEFE